MSSTTGSRAVAHRAADAPQVVLGVGDDVRAPQPVHLDAVLERAQELVRRRERARVVAADVAPGRERLQRRASSSALCSMTSLRPCTSWSSCTENSTSRRPPGAELELAVGVLGRDVLLDPAAHRLHVLDEVRPVGRGPDERRDEVDERLPEREVARGRACLEQRLELPGRRPAPVVALVGRERAHERAVLALGPQVGVDLPDRRPRSSARRRRA